MSEFAYLQCMGRAAESAHSLCVWLGTDSRAIDAPMRDLETALRRGASPVAIWGRWVSWLCAELVVRGVMVEVPELERLAVEASGNVSGLRATEGVASEAFVAAVKAVDLGAFITSGCWGRLVYASTFLRQLGEYQPPGCSGLSPFDACRIALCWGDGEDSDGKARSAFMRQAAEMFAVACSEATPADHRR